MARLAIITIPVTLVLFASSAPMVLISFPVTEHHDVESGRVNRPIAVTCNVSAAMPRNWEYTLLPVLRDYHCGHSHETKGTCQSQVVWDSHRTFTAPVQN